MLKALKKMDPMTVALVLLLVGVVAVKKYAPKKDGYCGACQGK